MSFLATLLDSVFIIFQLSLLFILSWFLPLSLCYFLSLPCFFCLSTWPLSPCQFPWSPWPRQGYKHNFRNVICSMDEGEKVLAVKTTSMLQWRKRNTTHDRFLGLYKWTALQFQSFSLWTSHIFSATQQHLIPLLPYFFSQTIPCLSLTTFQKSSPSPSPSPFPTVCLSLTDAMSNGVKLLHY